MVKKVNLVLVSEVLSIAQIFGYEKQEAYDILVKDRIFPIQSWNYIEYMSIDFDEERNPDGYSDDTLKIMNALCEEHNMKEFILVCDNKY